MTETSSKSAIYASSKYKELAVELIKEIGLRDDIPLDIKAKVLNCILAEQESRQRLRELATAWHLDTIEAL